MSILAFIEVCGLWYP